MAEQISGKVAAIENNYGVVINRGSKDNVKKGMVFVIEDPKGQEIRDPDNPDDVLGHLPVEKIKVKVFDVQERLCRAETFNRARSPESPYETAARQLLDDYQRQSALDFTKMFRPAGSPLDPDGKLRQALQLLQLGAATRTANERPAVVEVNVGDVAREVQG